MDEQVTEIEGGPGESRLEVYRRRHGLLSRAGVFAGLAGEGGMGAVLRVSAFPGREQDPVVVKVLREELLGRPRAAERFRRELAVHHKLTSVLQVPRLAPCLAWRPDEEPGRIFGAFPYYSQGTLVDLMDAGGAVADGLRALADAVEGLQALHGLGYVHRDVCARNVFVEREGGVVRGVLGDLGVAVPLGGDTVFDADQVAQDLRSPTGHRGHVDPWHAGTAQGDLYSVGATLVWLLTGSHPPASALEAGLEGSLGHGGRSGVRPQLLEAAAPVVRRLTCRDLGARFQTAREAREAVAGLAEAAPESAVAGKGRWLAAGLAAAVAVGAAGVALLGPGPFAGGRPATDAAREQGASSAAGVAVEAVVPSHQGPPEHGTGHAPGQHTSAPAPGAEIRDRAPAGPTAPGSSVAPERLVQAAHALIEAGRAEHAEAALVELAAHYPADPDVAGALAVLKARGGPAGADEARQLLERALAANPGRGDLRLALARALAQLGLAGEALQVLEAAPPGGSHGQQVDALAVTLASSAHRE